MRHHALLLMILAWTFLLTGCGGGYVITGRVVEGGFGSAQFVKADDAELVEPGLPHASISVYRDANRPNQRLITKGRTNEHGMIEIPINEFGAGWMQETWLIEVVKHGYETVQTVIELPSSGKDMRLLVVLAPGVSVPPKKAEDLWEEYERFK